MRNLLILFIFLISFISLRAQNLSLLSDQSVIKFQINNFGMGTDGYLSKPSGTIIFNSTQPLQSQFDVSVPVNTINTDNDHRDTHLKSADFFDVSSYPQISLNSTKIEATNKANTYSFTGNLTIKNTTKPVHFPFSVQNDGGVYVFTGSFSINRLDFGVGSESMTLGNDVKVSIKVSAK